MTTQSISIELPKPAPLLSAKGWTAFLLALTMVCAVAPALNLWVPEDSALHLSDYMLGLLGKFMCYAICALAIDLIWGYTGIKAEGFSPDVGTSFDVYQDF